MQLMEGMKIQHRNFKKGITVPQPVITKGLSLPDLFLNVQNTFQSVWYELLICRHLNLQQHCCNPFPNPKAKIKSIGKTVYVLQITQDKTTDQKEPKYKAYLYYLLLTYSSPFLKTRYTNYTLKGVIPQGEVVFLKQLYVVSITILLETGHLVTSPYLQYDQIYMTDTV